MKPIVFFLTCLLGFITYAQEDCANGIDDDDDGFADLYDTECNCISNSNKIYNGDFELYTLPEALQPWNIANADGWIHPTNSFNNAFARAQYSNKNFIDHFPNTTFPSGSGAAAVENNSILINTGSGEFEGSSYHFWKKELMASNLIDRLVPNKTYIFSAYVYRKNPSEWVTWPQLSVTLWGKTETVNSFELEFGSCPTATDNWSELVSLPFYPKSEWIKLEKEFTVNDEILGIIIGLQCLLPVSYYNLSGTKLIGIDDVSIKEVSEEVSLFSSGQPCSEEINLRIDNTSSFVPTSYQWYLNGNAIPNATTAAYNLNESSIQGYYAARMMSSNGTCRTSSSYGYIKPEFNFDYALEIDENSNTVSLNNIFNLQDYSFSIDAINFQSQPVFTNLEPGTYTITVMSVEGCKVTEVDVVLFKIYNVITPNSDGYNDTWYIEGLEKYPGSTITLFDRYGIERYKYVIPENLTEYKWDGKVRGRAVPSNTYYYIISVADNRKISGALTIKNR